LVKPTLKELVELVEVSWWVSRSFWRAWQVENSQPTPAGLTASFSSLPVSRVLMALTTWMTLTVLMALLQQQFQGDHYQVSRQLSWHHYY
jgi:hypothetical protein